MKANDLAGLTLLSICLLLPAAAPADDDYLRGYVAAIVEREFGLEADAVSVHRGAVTIRADLSEANAEHLRLLVSEIEGVKRVQIVSGDTRQLGFVWFPGSSLFAPLLADPRWPRFSASATSASART